MESPFAVTEWFCCFVILLFIFDRVWNFRNVLDRRFCLFRHLATTSEEPFREFRSSTWCTISVFDHDILYIAKRDLHLKKAKRFLEVSFLFFLFSGVTEFGYLIKEKNSCKWLLFYFFQLLQFFSKLRGENLASCKVITGKKVKFCKLMI